MDWPRDNTGISDADLGVVFKYVPRDSTVVQILQGTNYALEISSLESDEQWEEWLEKDLPKLDGTESGLILLLAKRPGEVPFPIVRSASSNDWSKFVNGQLPLGNGGALGSHSKTFSALAEGQPLSEKHAVQVKASGQPKTSPRRGVRTMPFTPETFRHVAKGMHTHGSIARVISRTDVPVFTADRVEMGGMPAQVYSCRSSNAWDLDLALSVTHFPGLGLTFAVVYGCYLSASDEVLRRLQRVAGADAAHPLLLPGIFAELERTRHMALVRRTISEVESRIFELDALQHQSEQRRQGGRAAERADRQNIDKRNAWLDTTYLRNGLVSWNTQLENMARHASEVDPAADGIGAKIQHRISSIRQEYDDWTRDCTMRVDGMAMATQWAQGEVSVEIAFDTKRDSQHMRSIALLTMVFLPGTFLASLFSMTFFDWSEDNTTVSSYIWLYFLFTTILTLLTLGLWYYFVVYRPSNMRRCDDEEDEDAES